MDASEVAPRALVLGGSGFLGRHLVEALTESGYRVRLFHRTSERRLHPSPPVEDWIGDVTSRSDVAAALRGCDIVFHLVSSTLPKTSNDDPVSDLETNLIATVRLLEEARIQRPRKIVFASSGGTVYGLPRNVPITEEHTTHPLCSYGVHKLAIEHYLHLYHHLYGLEYSVLRVSNAFGEHQQPAASQGAVATFLDRALRGETIQIWGDGSIVRDYVYAGDVARAFCLAARHSGAPRVFNIGSGRGISVNELLATIEAVLGQPVPRRYLPGRPFDVPVNLLDITRAAEHLGWHPRYSFEEGLRRTLVWRRSDDRTGAANRRSVLADRTASENA